MTTLISFYLNPVIHYSVIFGFLIFCIFHQFLIDRLMRRYHLNLGFLDKLLLFRVPFWSAKIPLANVVLTDARLLAKLFSLIVFLMVLFFAIALVVIYFS